jgi:Na+-transporting methylmalonyl-CoA/oxaloacetate decarboxylase gamma subunit
MNKKIIIAVVVIILLLIGAGAYVMSTSKSKTTPITTSNSQTNNRPEPTAQSDQKSLKDILAAGLPQKCTYTDVTDQTSINGTTYIFNGKVRADFTSVVAGKMTTGHTIYDGKTSYIWTDGTTSGFKMEIDTSAPSLTGTPTQQQGLDLNKTVDYSCGAWLPDTSLFNPPSDVTFTTFSIPTPGTGNTTQGKQNLCSSCNSLSGAQKTQCLSVLKCN